MGTFYNITLQSDIKAAGIQRRLDSLLNVFEDELSTYRPNSTISIFNQSPLSIKVDTSSYFYQSFVHAKDLYEMTSGYYDPTIAPLVNYYGFGADKQLNEKINNKDTIASILKLVGYNKIDVKKQGEKASLIKSYPAQKLDLNASAKGMGVDIVADYLESLNIQNYLIEIGGEVRAKGVNDKGSVWTLGINKPSQDATSNTIILPVVLDDKGMATSGNYRQFYKEGKLTFAHIINPITGVSEITDVLSATVIAKDCQTADGYATALIAMGLQKSISLVEKLNNIETCLIYQDQIADTLAFYYSSGFDKNIKR